ncbi:uncharacterized protein LOC130672206 isoform X2 [Microplitis mediator]|uniref:uncharacterized protein LOC130672206 isoform X2 n=1 Tax=Microplitis mediator TaxID=375433 RepID=UPI0025534802|nr:uncharacterized protein LOC130672206 isoform X2 [Microplitis mediator]
MATNLEEREVTDLESIKDKPHKRKKNNDSEIHSFDEVNNKENNSVDPKKIKKEPGYKLTLVRGNDDILAKEPGDLYENENEVFISEPTSSNDFLPPLPHHGSSSSTTEKQQSSTTFLRPSTSNMGSNDLEDKMKKNPVLEQKAIVVTPGKDKKKKKHHFKEEKIITQMDQMQSDLSDVKKEQQLQSQMLQKLLDFWNEHRDTPSNLGSVELEKKTGFPQVGFTRVSDNSIHLGQGVFVSKNSYLAAKTKAKSASQFVRQMLIAVFTPEELQNSSVHGAKSNKIKQEQQKPGLDPTRLQAVKDITSYYLKESGISKQRYDADIKAFYSYVTSKITDSRAETKRPSKPEESRVMKSNIEENIEENTLASDSEESSGDSDDEETSTELEKDDENKKDTEKDKPNKEDSEFVAENVDDELTKTIGPEESSDLIKEEHKAHDYENVEE